MDYVLQFGHFSSINHIRRDVKMEDTDEDVPSSPLPPEFIINDLPEEILERVLSYLSPYSEVHVAARVCKLWRRLIQGEYASPLFKRNSQTRHEQRSEN